MKRGEIVYVNLPLNPDSHSQGGRRPSIVVISELALPKNPMVMMVPLTSNLAALRFPFTWQVDPSAQNGLSKSSVALVFQLCAVDRTHVGRVLGMLEDHHMQKIDEMIRQLLDV
jgi:mRNA-degrading endonuclease toxin of MazEF toxin-antitoxin module